MHVQEMKSSVDTVSSVGIDWDSGFHVVVANININFRVFVVL